MNKTIVIIVLSLAPLINIYAQTQERFFKIVGKVSGFADSTKIYLNSSDSTFIINGKFNFSGSVDDKEMMTLHTKGYADYNMLWIENSTIHFHAQKGDFRNAKITGSAIQTLADSLQEKIDKFGDARNQYVNFIKANPNSLLSVYLLDGYAATWGRDTTEMLFKDLIPQMQHTSYGTKISNFIALNKNVKIGDRYWDFEQLNPANKSIKLSDLKSKVILLEFWGSWCMPCRKGHPDLIRIYNKYKKSGFEILGVASDSNRAQWINAIKEDRLPWENVSDLKGDENEAALIYGINHYPTNFLIKDGVIIAVDLKKEDLETELAKLLK
ncbi:thioredoxin-like domain-containing protein [Sphingobacterium anhuiense]|uniref:thioredoxin-like domain-containing protein n=1 Tax=Sphingobacterium anhuiense TaxID=493780 RepID=UPI003C2BB4CD